VVHRIEPGTFQSDKSDDEGRDRLPQLTDDGVRSLCRKYSAVIGVRLHPHVFRHSFAKQFLADNGNDLVSLAQILGHENLNTTSRYSQKTEEQLAAGSERVSW